MLLGAIRESEEAGMRHLVKVSHMPNFPITYGCTAENLKQQPEENQLRFWKASRLAAHASQNGGMRLPPNAQLSSTMVAHDAVMRGRARALPFFANKPDDKSLPPPGAVLFLDFAGMMIPSRGHRFRC